jgi:pimeloyl-ACP methyl ester carboxylesterase
VDIELYYQEKGNGEPFIMLHGNGENSDYFCNQIEYFSKNYHVIAIDTRGHGKSPRGEAPFTNAQFADDLYDFIMQKELKKAIILGFSDGANIANSELMIIKGNHFVANKNPEEFNKVVDGFLTNRGNTI